MTISIDVRILILIRLKFSTGKFDAFISALVGYSTNSREGLFSHYLYDNSYGESGAQNFWNFGMKGQLTYKLNGRMFFVYNGHIILSLLSLTISLLIHERIIP